MLSRRSRAAKKDLDAVSSECAGIEGNNADYDVKQGYLAPSGTTSTRVEKRDANISVERDARKTAEKLRGRLNARRNFEEDSLPEAVLSLTEPQGSHSCR